MDLVGRPDVELALDAFAIGILAAIETAAFVAHFKQDVVEGFLGDSAVQLVARDLPGVKVDARKLGIVVEHLFEMRNQPAMVDRVSGKAATELIVHPTLRHLLKRDFRHLECVRIADADALAQ